MKNRPISVIIVSLLFIATGILGIIYHLKDFSNSSISTNESILVMLIRLLAIVCGILLFKRVRWARWLAIAWLVYHVFLSIYHSPSELITHIVFLIIVSVLLFLPSSNAFFNNTKVEVR